MASVAPGIWRHRATVVDWRLQARAGFLALGGRVRSVWPNSGRGFPGTERLRGLLLDSGGDSYLERRFLGLVRTAGLPKPTCQVVHRVDGKRIARVDFQFPDTKIIVEVSGRLGHVIDTLIAQLGEGVTR